MPHKKVTLERKDIAIAFFILTIAFVGMGLIINSTAHKAGDAAAKAKTLTKANARSIRLIQRSRIESCKLTFATFRDVIYISVEDTKARQGGKLKPAQARNLSRYLARLDPRRCRAIVTPPRPSPPKKKP